MSSSAGAAQASSSAPKRRKPYVQKACTACRRRKTRCEGGLPKCAGCLHTGEECVYLRDVDGRKPASNSFVEALQARVTALESVENENKVLRRQLDRYKSGQPYREFSASPPPDPSPAEGAAASPNESLTEMVEGLKIDNDSGELRYYGATSSLLHLPNPTTPRLETASMTAPPEIPLQTSYATNPFAPDDVDWHKYLPEAPRLTGVQHTHLLEATAAFYAPAFHLPDILRFVRDMRESLRREGGGPVPRPARTGFYSPMLHNALLAYGSTFPSTVALPPGSDEAFARKAISFVESEVESPTTSTVLGLMLLGTFRSGRLAPNLGTLYMGMAIRMSQVMGLNCDCTAYFTRGDITADVKKLRDSTFWTLFIDDKLWSNAMGRSASIRGDDHEVPPPQLDSDRDAQPWQLPLGWVPPRNCTQEVADGLRQRMPPRGMRSTILQQYASLSTLNSDILETVYSIKANLRDLLASSAVSDLTLRLERWREAMPQELEINSISPSSNPPLPSVIFLHLLHHHMTILLHRPFYFPKNDHLSSKFSIKRCDNAAKHIVQLVQLYDGTYGLRYTGINADQICFAAGKTLLMAAVLAQSHAPKRKQEACEGVEFCISALAEIGGTWKCAARSSGILSQLYHECFPPEAQTHTFDFIMPSPVHAAPPNAHAQSISPVDSIFGASMAGGPHIKQEMDASIESLPAASDLASIFPSMPQSLFPSDAPDRFIRNLEQPPADYSAFTSWPELHSLQSDSSWIDGLVLGGETFSPPPRGS